MSNEMFIKQYQSLYESLSYFSYENNVLTLNLDKPSKIYLRNVSLANVNPILFLLKPMDIYKILYVLELLHKAELNENEINFINNFTSDYLKLNDKALANQEVDLTTYNGFKIPIYLSYDPLFINTPASIIIQNTINTYTEEINNGRGNQIRLVRINPNTPKYDDESNLKLFGQAGFTTLLLIGSTIVATCLYIVKFILGN